MLVFDYREAAPVCIAAVVQDVLNHGSRSILCFTIDQNAKNQEIHSNHDMNSFEVRSLYNQYSDRIDNCTFTTNRDTWTND